jgi:hypothetical protein
VETVEEALSEESSAGDAIQGKQGR